MGSLMFSMLGKPSGLKKINKKKKKKTNKKTADNLFLIFPENRI